MIRSILMTLGWCALVMPFLHAQTQTIRGQVVDKETLAPLTGANIQVLLDTGFHAGTSSDAMGSFQLDAVPVGRITIAITYLGYEPLHFPSVLLTAAKELVLEVEMVESSVLMQEVVVVGNEDKSKPLNEMATVSARSFSVEETSRYAASYFDPARMAQNFAGVNTGSGFDLENEIIVRGNSPAGILWRLDGIEIPNPNHFASLGNSGGAVSMLSSTTLANSDFYTGAFPAEFGNATAGVFDLRLRNGNNQKGEYSFMVGALGLEVGAEGPFTKKHKASFLINYRYSTLAALEAIGLSPAGDVAPAYQDLSFKINIPTSKLGTFSIFGLGGKNRAHFEPEQDTTTWEFKYDNWGFDERQRVGSAGLSHNLLISERGYLRTVAIASFNEGNFFENSLDSIAFDDRLENQTQFTQTAYRLSSYYHHKINAKSSIRTGFIYSRLAFDFFYDDRGDDDILRRYFDNEGYTSLFQLYTQWKHKFSPAWTLVSGVHYTHLFLEHQFSIEPRAALQWQINSNRQLSFSAGLHSKVENLAVYLFEGETPDGEIQASGRDLELTKSLHLVLGYDWRISSNLRLNTELYFQYLFDVPIEGQAGSTKSILNASNVWDVIGIENAQSGGNGRNMGLDVTLEKFFTKQYYFLLTGSVYDSRFRPFDGNWYSTRFNGNYQLNLVGGKEFSVGKRKQNILGFNGKFVISGGNRYTPIDLEASRAAGEAVLLEDQPFSERSGFYYRFDLGLSYRINSEKVTHSLLLDIQNVTNRLNMFVNFYDEDTETIEAFYQTGLFPVFAYRIEF